MNIGSLEGMNIDEHAELLPAVILSFCKTFLEKAGFSPEDISVVSIDPSFSDTASFCEHYAVRQDESANCVIVEGKRGDIKQYAACVVLATTKVDVNGLVRKQLDCRKVSFASMADAVAKTDMEYGAITPIGLPSDWVILIDSHVVASEKVIIGGGIRKSKLLVKGSLLAQLPNVIVLEDLGIERI